MLALDIILEGRKGKKSRYRSTSGIYYFLKTSENPLKVLVKVRDFSLFCDYICTKVIGY
jgi:hypothetical protein